MKLLFNNSIYNINNSEDAIDIIKEYCSENNLFYDTPHNDNGDSVIDIYDVYVDDEGTLFKDYQLQAVIRFE